MATAIRVNTNQKGVIRVFGKAQLIVLINRVIANNPNEISDTVITVLIGLMQFVMKQGFSPLKVNCQPKT